MRETEKHVAQSMSHGAPQPWCSPALVLPSPGSSTYYTALVSSHLIPQPGKTSSAVDQVSSRQDAVFDSFRNMHSQYILSTYLVPSAAQVTFACMILLNSQVTL
jgi:hypothetical protein